MDIPCQCESAEHFDDTAVKYNVARKHDYLSVPAGSHEAIYVGEICDECAETHMKEYLTS